MPEKLPDNIAYTIETRDINGKRETHTFATREEFYAWALDVDQNKYGPAYELEILLITCAIPVNGTYEQSILFCSLVHPAVYWSELVAYLA